MNGHIAEIECPDCEGWGFLKAGSLPCGPICNCCKGKGWRPMTDDELDAAAEKQAEADLSEPPVTLAEQHRAAWDQKQELRR